MADHLDGRLERLYGGELPAYLTIHNKDHITIRAAQYEGADVQDIDLTPLEVVRYYVRPDELGAGGFSGIRHIAGFSSDWRLVDHIARESMTIFRLINEEGLKQAASEYGDRLREGHI